MPELIDEARTDLQAGIAELRSLAHGIFPPLLMSGGLTDALPAATVGRATLPTDVDVETSERFPIDVEAAVYFCCLEALQNAGKHAGERASVHVRVWRDDDALHFSVTDDGVGFVPGFTRGGQGFLNMADRLGAFGGSVTVHPGPGGGPWSAGRCRSTTDPSEGHMEPVLATGMAAQPSQPLGRRRRPLVRLGTRGMSSRLARPLTERCRRDGSAWPARGRSLGAGCWWISLAAPMPDSSAPWIQACHSEQCSPAK